MPTTFRVQHSPVSSARPIRNKEKKRNGFGCQQTAKNASNLPNRWAQEQFPTCQERLCEKIHTKRPRAREQRIEVRTDSIKMRGKTIQVRQKRDSRKDRR